MAGQKDWGDGQHAELGPSVVRRLNEVVKHHSEKVQGFVGTAHHEAIESFFRQAIFVAVSFRDGQWMEVALRTFRDPDAFPTIKKPET